MPNGQARRGRIDQFYKDVAELLDTRLTAVRPANRFMDGTVVTSKWQQALDQDDWTTETGKIYPEWW